MSNKPFYLIIEQKFTSINEVKKNEN